MTSFIFCNWCPCTITLSVVGGRLAVLIPENCILLSEDCYFSKINPQNDTASIDSWITIQDDPVTERGYKTEPEDRLGINVLSPIWIF